MDVIDTVRHTAGRTQRLVIRGGALPRRPRRSSPGRERGGRQEVVAVDGQ